MQEFRLVSEDDAALIILGLATLAACVPSKRPQVETLIDKLEQKSQFDFWMAFLNATGDSANYKGSAQ